MRVTLRTIITALAILFALLVGWLVWSGGSVVESIAFAFIAFGLGGLRFLWFWLSKPDDGPR